MLPEAHAERHLLGMEPVDQRDSEQCWEDRGKGALSPSRAARRYCYLACT